MNAIRRWLARRFFKAAIAINPPWPSKVGVGITETEGQKVLWIERGEIWADVCMTPEEAKEIGEDLLMADWEARAVATRFDR